MQVCGDLIYLHRMCVCVCVRPRVWVGCSEVGTGREEGGWGGGEVGTGRYEGREGQSGVGEV